jgi:hypothetical protein
LFIGDKEAKMDFCRDPVQGNLRSSDHMRMKKKVSEWS